MTISNTITGRQAYSSRGVLEEMENLPVIALRDPTTADINYPVGQRWINQTSNAIFMMTRVTAGSANWDSIGGVGEDPITRYVVSPDGTGDYTTIATAIAAGVAATGVFMVYVKGNATTYTENLTLPDNLILIGEGIQTSITGVHTPPATGAVLMSNIYFISATDVITSAAAGTTRLRFTDCTFNCTNGYVVDCASWTGPIDIFNCHTASTADGVVRVGASTVAIENSFVGAGANALSITGGTLAVRGSRIACPISPAGANAGSITEGSFIGGTVTLAGTSAMAISNSTLSTGAAAAITQSSAGVLTVTDSTITSSANPCITGAGAGAVTFSNVNFTSNSLLAAGLTRAYVAETKSTRAAFGDNTYRVTTVGAENNVVQSYCLDPTATGASARHAIEGNMTMATGDGNATPVSVKGTFNALATGNVLTAYGVVGECLHTDAGKIVSTAAGVEGIFHSYETGAADLPQFIACGTKGYLVGEDAAAVPTAGIWAGLCSAVTYSTPLNTYAYGVAATRLGAGAGTAARAAFGVCQGTNAAADWLYGLDLYNTVPGYVGVAYTTADMRFQNQTTLKSSTEGLTCSGNLTARSLLQSNTKITAFNSEPIGQLYGGAGALCTGATGTVNNIHIQDGIMMQSFMIGAGQTKILPILETDGLEIALDLTNTEGVEYNFGTVSGVSKHQYTIGTSAAFFVEAKFKVADVSGCEPLLIGFRKVEANNGTYTAYTDYATIGIKTSANADLITISTELNGGGTTDTNTTNAFTDGQTHTLRVNVSAAGVVTYTIDGAAPGATAAFTFDAADVVMPFIYITHAAVAPGKIHAQTFDCGLQAST